MKRSAFDVLRRAFDNTVANWPLLLLRLAEAIAFGVIAIAAALAIVVPILVSVGIQFANLSTPESIEEAMFALAQKWILLVWIALGVFVLLLVFLAVHAFVEAGCARVLVDGERNAGPGPAGPRSRYRVFSLERWFSGGAAGWWTLFWIYNLAWGAASIVLLIPLLPTIALMLLFGSDENPEAAVGIGCLGLVITLFLGFLVAVVTSIWTNRAIADWGVRRAGARDALATAWAAVKIDFGRHLVIALAVVVVAMAGSAVFSSLSFFAGMGDIFNRGHSSIPFFLFPIQMFGSLLNSAFSAAVFTWFLAAYAALALEHAE